MMLWLWTVNTRKPRHSKSISYLLTYASSISGSNVEFDFIYVPEPGKETFIYVIDDGINLDVLNVSAYSPSLDVSNRAVVYLDRRTKSESSGRWIRRRETNKYSRQRLLSSWIRKQETTTPLFPMVLLLLPKRRASCSGWPKRYVSRHLQKAEARQVELSVAASSLAAFSPRVIHLPYLMEVTLTMCKYTGNGDIRQDLF